MNGKSRRWTHHHKCGCCEDGQRWLEVCPAHRLEEAEIHKRWGQDHLLTTGNSAPTMETEDSDEPLRSEAGSQAPAAAGSGL